MMIMNTTKKILNPANKQTGAVLVTALVLMGVLTLLGITAMRSNMMDIQVHKAMKSRANAFQCAEAALRAGEMWMDNVSEVPTTISVAVGSAAVPSQSANQVWKAQSPKLLNMDEEDDAWWESNGWTYGDDLIDATYQLGCATEPRFIIEHLGTVSDSSQGVEFKQVAKEGMDYYRITAHSIGVSDTAAVVLQTTYGKRLR